MLILLSLARWLANLSNLSNLAANYCCRVLRDSLSCSEPLRLTLGRFLPVGTCGVSAIGNLHRRTSVVIVVVILIVVIVVVIFVVVSNAGRGIASTTTGVGIVLQARLVGVGVVLVVVLVVVVLWRWSRSAREPHQLGLDLELLLNEVLVWYQTTNDRSIELHVSMARLPQSRAAPCHKRHDARRRHILSWIKFAGSTTVAAVGVARAPPAPPAAATEGESLALSCCALPPRLRGVGALAGAAGVLRVRVDGVRTRLRRLGAAAAPGVAAITARVPISTQVT